MTPILRALVFCGLVIVTGSPAMPGAGTGLRPVVGDSTGGGSYSERPHCDTSVSDGACVRAPGERRHHARRH